MSFASTCFASIFIGLIAIICVRLKAIKKTKTHYQSMTVRELKRLAAPILQLQTQPKLNQFNEPHLNPELYAFHLLFLMASTHHSFATTYVKYRDEWLTVDGIQREVMHSRAYGECRNNDELEELWYDIMVLVVKEVMKTQYLDDLTYLQINAQKLLKPQNI